MSPTNKVIVFDTTLRDGELTPGVKMNLQQKMSISQVLEAMRVDVIEVGYPGRYQKDFAEVFEISKIIKQSTICALASANPQEIELAAAAIEPATKPRIHTYASVNIRRDSQVEREVLESIKDSVRLARTYCDDVEWTAFDATRSDSDFLCKAIETAISSGATTVNIPDSLGLASTAEFSQLLQLIFNRVSNIDRAIASVHCHDDLGIAVENSLAALDCGVRQIEGAIDGLGARKGNADLRTVVNEIENMSFYNITIDKSLFPTVSDLVAKVIN